MEQPVQQVPWRCWHVNQLYAVACRQQLENSSRILDKLLLNGSIAVDCSMVTPVILPGLLNPRRLVNSHDVEFDGNLRSTDAQPPIHLSTHHTLSFFLPTSHFARVFGEASGNFVPYLTLYTALPFK